MKFEDVDLILENEIIRKACLSRIHSRKLSISKIATTAKVHIRKVRSYLEKRESKINHLELQAITAVMGINLSVSLEEFDLPFDQETALKLSTERILKVKKQYYD